MGIITLPDVEMVILFSIFLFILFFSSSLALAIMERNGI